MDVLACRPGCDPVHVETAVDAGLDNIKRMKERFLRARQAYQDVLNVAPEGVKRKAIVYGVKFRSELEEESVEVKSREEFLREVIEAMKNRDPTKSVVPEALPLLRTIQEVMHVLKK